MGLPRRNKRQSCSRRRRTQSRGTAQRQCGHLQPLPAGTPLQYLHVYRQRRRERTVVTTGPLQRRGRRTDCRQRLQRRNTDCARRTQARRRENLHRTPVAPHQRPYQRVYLLQRPDRSADLCHNAKPGPQLGRMLSSEQHLFGLQHMDLAEGQYPGIPL